MFSREKRVVTPTTKKRLPYSTKPGEMVNISVLPDEILVLLCSFLDVKDLCTLGSVDQRFTAIVSEPVLWDGLYDRLLKDHHRAHVWIGWRPLPLDGDEGDADKDGGSKQKVKALLQASRPTSAKDSHHKKEKDDEHSSRDKEASTRKGLFSKIKTKIRKSEEGEEDPSAGDWRRDKFRNVKKLTDHVGKIYHVACTSDGKMVASVAQDGRIIIWDVSHIKDAEKVQKIPLKSSWVMGCAWSPSSKLVAIGGLDNFVTLYSIDGKNHTLQRELQGHTGYVGAIEFQDDNHVLSGSGDQTIIEWDVATGQTLQTFASFNGDVMAVTVHPQNRCIFAGSGCDKSLRIFDARAGVKDMLNLTGHESDVNACVYSPNGVAIASTGDDSSVCLWDARIPTTPQSTTPPTTTTTTPTTTEEKQHPALLCRYAKETLLAGQTSLCFSPDGSVIFVGSDGQAIHRWDTISGQLLRDLGPNPHTGRVSTLKLSPDGRYIVSGSWDTTVRIWPL